MSKAVLIARILLGLIFVVFSANYVLHFIPVEANDAAGAFMGALGATGYMWPVIKLIEFVSGAMLLAGFGVPLALVLLAPIVVNIVLLHVFLDTAGLPVAILVLALEAFLAWAYCDSWKGVLDFRAKTSKG